DIAIPVYNEERDLERSVRRLRRYLDHQFPFEARITVVDNASTDATWAIAQRLVLELRGVRALRLDDKGRGRAIRHAWLESAEAARRLLPLVANQEWFFDTELLVQAQRAGLRIYEVPVDWTDDPDSRVDVVATAIEDLRGVWRLSRQLRSFAAIGILSTLAYIACYSALRLAVPATIANALSLVLTAIANTAANRRFTFLARRNGAARRDHLGGLAAFGVAL